MNDNILYRSIERQVKHSSAALGESLIMTVKRLGHTIGTKQQSARDSVQTGASHNAVVVARG